MTWLLLWGYMPVVIPEGAKAHETLTSVFVRDMPFGAIHRSHRVRLDPGAANLPSPARLGVEPVRLRSLRSRATLTSDLAARAPLYLDSLPRTSGSDAPLRDGCVLTTGTPFGVQKHYTIAKAGLA